MGSPLGQPSQAGVAGLALDRDLERLGASPGDRRVGLPMPEAAALQDMGRTLANGDPSGDVGFLMAARVPTALAGAVGSHQAGDKMARLRIDPLVDRFVADGLTWEALREPAGGKLRRPAPAEPAFHVAADGVVLKATVAPGLAVAIFGALLCFVGKIVAGVNRRRVAPELPRDGAGIAAQEARDLPQGAALTSIDGQKITFMTAQVIVGFWHGLRIVTRRPSRPPSVALRY